MPDEPPADLPGISEAELTLLKLLWDAGPSTVRAVHAQAEDAGHDWAYTTVQTMLSRMEEKGYVSVDRDGFAHVFAARVTRRSLVGRRLDELQDKLCDGAVVPMLLHLAEGHRFSREEIERFRALLDDAERDADRQDGGGDA